jgi:hypothetical protein
LMIFISITLKFFYYIPIPIEEIVSVDVITVDAILINSSKLIKLSEFKLTRCFFCCLFGS